MSSARASAARCKNSGVERNNSTIMPTAISTIPQGPIRTSDMRKFFMGDRADYIPVPWLREYTWQAGRIQTPMKSGMVARR
jgi:hypothetical protein